MAKQFTIGKNERLKSRKQIELLFGKGRRFVSPPYRVFYMANDDQPGPLLFGVAVGTKSFKRAVDRNRVKRLIREAWRLQKKELENLLEQQKRQLNVFIVYTGKELPVYTDVFQGMAQALDKLIKSIS